MFKNAQGAGLFSTAQTPVSDCRTLFQAVQILLKDAGVTGAVHGI